MRPVTSIVRRRRERGMAMVMALFSLTTLMIALTSALLVGTSDERATRNYRGASQVHFAAESAISDALQAVNATGVIQFQRDVFNRWSQIFGSGSRNFATAGYTYTVTTVLGANPANDGYLIATAQGPESVRNTVVAKVTRSDAPNTAPGAIYLATNQTTDATFNGDTFTIDGNDRNLDGSLAPGGVSVPGIATRSDQNTTETRNSLSAGQKDNVQGQGYVAGSPAVPSVFTSPAAPSVDQMNAFIDDLLSKPRPPDYNIPQIVGNSNYGDEDHPQISHFTGDGGLVIKGAGTVLGAGIMIVEGNLTILGHFEFDGLVLVRGQVTIGNDPLMTTISGDATVYGSLWTENLDLDVGGNGKVFYSSQALALANQVSGGAALPAPLKVLALADCTEVPAGVGGCPQ
jgi:hypothetical protein